VDSRVSVTTLGTESSFFPPGIEPSFLGRPDRGLSTIASTTSRPLIRRSLFTQ